MNNKLKSSILFVFLLLFFSDFGSAQEKFVEGSNRFKIGGLGYVSLGYSFNLGNSLEKNLEKTFLLNSSLPSFGYNIGGGGYFLFERKFIVSGNGFGLNFQNVINKSNEMSFGGGGGGFSFGYIAYNRYDWMIFPSIGFGGMAVNMNIRNTADSLIYFGDFEIPIRTETEFNFSQSYLDIGVSAHKLIRIGNTIEKANGISFGLSVGYIAGLGEHQWQQNGTEVNGLNPSKYNSFYIKMSIGGGWFLVR